MFRIFSLLLFVSVLAPLNIPQVKLEMYKKRARVRFKKNWNVATNLGE
jgi:hypothetical protein